MRGEREGRKWRAGGGRGKVKEGKNMIKEKEGLR